MLAAAGAPLGVVTAIVGYARGELVFEGSAGHAGTTPMAGRDDALVEAAAAVLRIRDAARAIPGAVATVGQIEVEPGGANVVPGRARISIDARAPDASKPRRADRGDRLRAEDAHRARRARSGKRRRR